MENQHRRITGYRELSEADIALMNDIKAFGESLEVLIGRVSESVQRQSRDALGPEHERLMNATPARWCAVAKTDFQTGLMALVRAVAQPTTF